MSQTQETQERDFLVCSLDLLSSLMDSMREGMESLVGQSNLLRLLYEAMKVRVVANLVHCLAASMRALASGTFACGIC